MVVAGSLPSGRLTGSYPASTAGLVLKSRLVEHDVAAAMSIVDCALFTGIRKLSFRTDVAGLGESGSISYTRLLRL